MVESKLLIGEWETQKSMFVMVATCMIGGYCDTYWKQFPLLFLLLFQMSFRPNKAD